MKSNKVAGREKGNQVEYSKGGCREAEPGLAWRKECKGGNCVVTLWASANKAVRVQQASTKVVSSCATALRAIILMVVVCNQSCYNNYGGRAVIPAILGHQGQEGQVRFSHVS
jgi:hypothetical protein